MRPPRDLDSPEHADPPNVGDVWPVWRVVSEGLATLTEIERTWWVEDLLDANEALDVLEHAGGSRRSRGSL